MARIISSDPRVKKYGLIVYSSSGTLEVTIGATKVIEDEKHPEEILMYLNQQPYYENPYVLINLTKEETEFILANHHKELLDDLGKIMNDCDESIDRGDLSFRKKKKKRLKTRLKRPLATTKSRTKQHGHVYIFRAGPTNLFKVGGTTNSPLHRIKEIQTGCPYPLEFYDGFESDDCWMCESKLHSALAEYRTVGEWFDLPENILWMAIEAIFV